MKKSLFSKSVCVCAVSYTHLDVYKRQATSIIDVKTRRGASVGSDHYMAVSYTHLDVYKRQLLGRQKI